MDSKHITLGDMFKEKEDKQRLRLKVSYKETNPEDEYRFDIKRALEEHNK